MMRKAVKAKGASTTIFSLATLVGAVGLANITGGCVKRDEPPFNPREMGRNTRIASRERIIRPNPSIPTTLESRPSTRPSVRAAASEGIGEEIYVRLSLQEIIQRTVASNSEV